jgi:hypothetical protein
MQIIQSMTIFLNKIRNLGGDACELRIDPPSTDKAVLQVEKELRMSIPSELRNTMLSFSSHLEFKWFLNDAVELPAEFRELFCGEIHWGLDLIGNYMKTYNGWVKEVFPNPENSYDAVWHNKFPFQQAGNGDFLSIDSVGKVVYLSHDDGEGHGYVMANSFSEFLDNWIPLGCPGGEDWQWLPFTNGMTTPIDWKSQNGQKWVALIDNSKNYRSQEEHQKSEIRN